MHENDFPIPLESLLATAAEILKGQGKTRELLVLLKARVSTLLVDFDNWNGGTYTWGLQCSIDLKHFGTIRNDLEEVGSTIRDVASVVLRDFKNHSLTQVTIFADPIANPDWRKDAEEEIIGAPSRMAKVVAELLSNPMPQLKRIFLSHKGADKPRVRRYKDTLKLLGLDPWLDEEDMPLGTVLERGIHKGMEDSCAAVFFITPSFKDENYLETEITYALHQRRKKGEKNFVIIMVVFREDEKTGKVPSILEPYVWGNPKDDLEALQAILKALPVKVGPVG